MPLFSVVVPLYNKADTIERTLRSVAEQFFRDFEVVVVDDGSNDNGAEIVSRFKGIENLRLVSQVNAGVSATRNKGVVESRGKYIAFLDADDEWKPTFLKEIAGILVAYPEARVLGTGYERIANGYLYCCRERRKLFVCDLFKVWPYFQPINSSSIVIEKQLFADIGGFNDKLRFWEDAELWFRLAAVERFFIVRKSLSRYNDDAQHSATGKCANAHRGMPHMDLLSRWISEGIATKEMVFCYTLTNRLMGTTICSNPIWWIYKRIRFYLWFYRRRCA